MHYNSMPTGIEVTKIALDDLKEEYLTIKALLNVSGVNLTDIDKIKE